MAQQEQQDYLPEGFTSEPPPSAPPASLDSLKKQAAGQKPFKAPKGYVADKGDGGTPSGYMPPALRWVNALKPPAKKSDEPRKPVAAPVTAPPAATPPAETPTLEKRFTGTLPEPDAPKPAAAAPPASAKEVAQTPEARIEDVRLPKQYMTPPVSVPAAAPSSPSLWSKVGAAVDQMAVGGAQTTGVAPDSASSFRWLAGQWPKLRSWVNKETEPTTVHTAFTDPAAGREFEENAAKRVGRGLFGIPDMGVQALSAIKDAFSSDPKKSEDGERRILEMHPGAQIWDRLKEVRDDYRRDPKLAGSNIVGDVITFWLAEKAGGHFTENVLPKLGEIVRNKGTLPAEPELPTGGGPAGGPSRGPTPRAGGGGGGAAPAPVEAAPEMHEETITDPATGEQHQVQVETKPDEKVESLLDEIVANSGDRYRRHFETAQEGAKTRTPEQIEERRNAAAELAQAHARNGNPEAALDEAAKATALHQTLKRQMATLTASADALFRGLSPAAPEAAKPGAPAKAAPVKAEQAALPFGAPEEGAPETPAPVAPQSAPEAPAPAAEAAPPEAPKPAAKGKKPANVASRRLEVLADHFTPGNVVYSGYWNDYDKVLAFKPPDANGQWEVQVVKSDKDGNPAPGERPRWHATFPDLKKDKVVVRAPEAAPAAAQEAPDGGGWEAAPPVEAELADARAIAAARTTPSAKSDAVRAGIGKWLKRAADEQQGQNLHEEMIANGESPREIETKFWTDTYFKLPAAVQGRFQRYLKSITGFQPGSLIAIDKDGNGVFAESWPDIAVHPKFGSQLPTDPEHLEGIERGYAVLMREANNRLAGVSGKATTPAPQVLPPPVEAPAVPPAAPKAAAAKEAPSAAPPAFKRGDRVRVGTGEPPEIGTVQWADDGNVQIKTGFGSIISSNPEYVHKAEAPEAPVVAPEAPEAQPATVAPIARAPAPVISFPEPYVHVNTRTGERGTTQHMGKDDADRANAAISSAGAPYRWIKLEGEPEEPETPPAPAPATGPVTAERIAGSSPPAWRIPGTDYNVRLINDKFDTYKGGDHFGEPAADLNAAKAQIQAHMSGQPEAAAPETAAAPAPEAAASPTPAPAKKRAVGAKAAEKSHAEARARTRDENAALVTAEKATRLGRPVIAANDDAMALLDRLMKLPGASNGLTIRGVKADSIIADLRQIAEDDPESHQGLTALADLMESHRTPHGNVIIHRSILSDPKINRIVLEELFHDWQHRYVIPTNKVIDIHGAMLLGPSGDAWRKVQSNLVKSYNYTPLVATLEAPAWVASGDFAHMGITPDEAAKLLGDYIETVHRYDRDAVNNLPPLAESLKGKVHDEIARRNLGKSGKDVSGGDRERVDPHQPATPGLPEKLPRGAAGAKRRKRAASEAELDASQSQQPEGPAPLETVQAEAEEHKPENWIRRGVKEFTEERGGQFITPPKVEADSRAMEIADAYEDMKHEPDNPAVKASYDALKADLDKQWDLATKKMGITFEPWDDRNSQPYKNSAEMKADVENNKHLFFFRGGDLPPDHPLVKTDPQTGFNYNEKMRAVHDLFGHAIEGHQFGPKGEEMAWLEHSQAFRPEAIPALTTETKGQNSWVNSGPQMRGPDGSLLKKGDPGWKPASEREYAKNKAGLLPRRFYYRQEAPVVFVSPNVFDLPGVPEAQAQLTSRIHKQFAEQAHQLAADMGLNVTVEHSLGSWLGGAENSIAIHLPIGTDPELVSFYEASLGRLGYQFATGSFIPNTEGKDLINTFWVDGKNVSTGKVAKVLLDNGIENSTITPADGRAKHGYAVTVIDTGNGLRDNLDKVTEELGVQSVDTLRGMAQFPGSSESRASAESSFSRILDGLEHKRPSLGEVRRRFESRPDYHLLYDTIRQAKEPRFVGVEHGSRTPELVQIDPAYHGKGPQGGGESKRKTAYPEYWIDRSYFQIKGTRGERPYIHFPHQYDAIFNHENLYDFHADPDGLKEQVPDSLKASSGGLATYYEKLIKDNGYDGYFDSERGQVAAFGRTPVEQKLKAGEIKLPESGEDNLDILQSRQPKKGPGKIKEVREEMERLNPRGSTVPIMESPLLPSYRDMWQIGDHLESYTRQTLKELRPGDTSAEHKAMVDRVVRIARDELKYQLAQENSGVDWYKKDVRGPSNSLISEMKKLHPELDDPVKERMFLLFTAGTSPGKTAAFDNANIAEQVYDLYKGTKKVPLRNPDGNKPWGTYGNAPLQTIQALLDHFGGDEAKATEWMLTKHPLKELEEIKGKTRFSEDTVENALPPDYDPEAVYGSYILGKKVGPFNLNLNGISTELTVDIWFMRTWNRLMGTLVGPDPKGKKKLIVLDKPRGKSERAAMIAAVDKLKEEFGLETSQVQAALWYYEQGLYNRLGKQGTYGGTYADAARDVYKLRSGGFTSQSEADAYEKYNALQGTTGGGAGPHPEGVRAEDTEGEDEGRGGELFGDESFDFGALSSRQQLRTLQAEAARRNPGRRRGLQ